MAATVTRSDAPLDDRVTRLLQVIAPFELLPATRYYQPTVGEDVELRIGETWHKVSFVCAELGVLYVVPREPDLVWGSTVTAIRPIELS